MRITPNNASKAFQRKSLALQQLLNQALDVLAALGIPLTGLSGRRLERMAMAFLVVADVYTTQGWPQLQDANSGRSLRTRTIISTINQCGDMPCKIWWLILRPRSST